MRGVGSVIRAAVRIGCGAGALGAGTAAHAQIWGFTPPAGWVVTVGGQIQAGPTYPGASTFGFGGTPWFSFRRAKDADIYQAPDDGLNIALWGNDWFRFGPSFEVNFGRYASDDHLLAGIHEVHWGVEAGGFGDVWPMRDRLRLHAEVRYGFNFHGVTTNLGADWLQPFGGMTFAIGPRLQLGDRGYNTAFFGTTAADAAANPLVSPFAPRGGLDTAGVLGSVTYAWNPKWTTSLFMRYDRLLGDAARSSIVRAAGSTDQFIMGISLRYSFYTGN